MARRMIEGVFNTLQALESHDGSLRLQILEEKEKEIESGALILRRCTFTMAGTSIPINTVSIKDGWMEGGICKMIEIVCVLDSGVIKQVWNWTIMLPDWIGHERQEQHKLILTYA